MSKETVPWVQAQKNTFENWINQSLKDTEFQIKDIKFDLTDGKALYALYRQLTGKKIKSIDHKPVMKINCLLNLNLVIDHFKKDKVKIVNVQGEDVYDKNLKLILGFIWMLILKYQILGDNEDEEAKAAKSLLLDFVNSMISGRKARNFTKDWKDGEILGKLVDAVEPGSFPEKMRPEDSDKLVSKSLDVAEEKLNIPKVIQPEYILNATDEHSLMTYISYFKQYTLNKRNEPYGPMCTASGKGLGDNANADSPHPFEVVLRNRYGESCSKLGNGPLKDLDVRFVGPETVQYNSKSEKAGYVQVEYEALTPGQYSIDVKIGANGDSIKDSPFTVNIYAGEVVVTGKGATDNEFVKGEKLPIQIDSGTKSGGLIETKKIAVSVKSPSGKSLHLDYVDHENGKYDVSYAPLENGKYEVSVNAFGKEVFSKKIMLLDSIVKQSKVILADELYDNKIIPNNRASGFSAQVVGQDGKIITDVELTVDVLNSDKFTVGDTIVDKESDGVFEVIVDGIEEVGDYVVRVKVDGILKESFDIECVTGVQAELVEGTFTFEVHARDPNGNLKTKGGDKWEVKIDSGKNSTVDVKTEDLGNGKYTATYHLATVAGESAKFVVHAKLDGVHVASSPFKHELAPKPSIGKRVKNFFKRSKN